jgi:uncharacterized protein
MKNEFNPFLTTSYHEPQYFCNRQKETRQLQKNINGHIHTTLFALRRLGKTGLIDHVFHTYKNNNKVVCIYLDILATKNLKEFTDLLATAIYNYFPKNKSLGQKVLDIVSVLRPTISYDALTGSPELSIDLAQPKQYETTVQQLFKFLDSHAIKVVLAIDEFQQILAYPEKNMEALLRTSMQQLKKTTCIFCGSNQLMMNEIFNSAKRPFFASCANMYLDFISHKDYSEFIKSHFHASKRRISSEAIQFILEWTNNHTYYTQFLCNRIFESNERNISLEFVRLQCSEILKSNEHIYFQYRNLLTDAQWNLLSAIAKENIVIQPHSKNFIKQYNLGTSSLVSRGMAALLDKELIYHNINTAMPHYAIYDKFLNRWLQ